MTERDAMELQSDKAMSVKGIYLTICKLVRLLISNIMRMSCQNLKFLSLNIMIITNN